MRTLFYTFILVGLSISVLAQTKDDDKERLRISQNKVKSITQWSHRFNQGKPSPTGVKTSETLYDKNGNPIEIISYRSSGEISSKVIYKYNSQNQRTEYIQYQKLNKPTIEVSYKQTFHYNNKGLKIQESVFDGATGYRITYEYFPDNQIKEIIKYGVGSKVDERWRYTYNGNKHEISIFKPDQVLSSMMRKEFDSKGNLVVDLRLDEKGAEQRRVEYKHDAKGRLQEMADFYSTKLTKRLEYLYNNQDLVIEIIQHEPDGKKFTQSQYKYDEKGSLIEERWSENRTEDFSHKQSVYNEKGNVLETDSYFASYRYRVLYKYTYEFF